MDIIFDIDGTLANNKHRSGYVETKPKNWAAYNKTMGDDEPIEVIINLNRIFAEHEDENGVIHRIILCSGREEIFRKITEMWLDHHSIQFDALYMRPEKDYRPDFIVKEELLARIKEDGFNPVLVIDDRKSVVDMWRRNGLVCLQCAEGDF